MTANAPRCRSDLALQRGIWSIATDLPDDAAIGYGTGWNDVQRLKREADYELTGITES